MASQNPLNPHAEKFVPVEIPDMQKPTPENVALVRSQTEKSLDLFQRVTPDTAVQALDTLRQAGVALCYALDAAMWNSANTMILAQQSGDTANTLSHATDTQATLLVKKEREISQLRNQIRILMSGKCLYDTKCTNSNLDHVKAFHSS